MNTLFTPKRWTSECKEPAYRIPWEGEIIAVPRTEAVYMRQAGLVDHIHSCAEGGMPVELKIEAMQWHFRNLGAPVICTQDKENRTVWHIICKAWKCSYPVKDPMKALGDLYKEILECAQHDTTPLNYNY